MAPSAAPLRLRPGLRFILQGGAGDGWFVLHDPWGDAYFRISPSVYIFASQLDGRRSLAQALACTARHLAPASFGEDEARAALAWLQANRLLQTSEGGPAAPPPLRPNPLAVLGHLNPLFIQVSLLQPQRLIERLYPWLRWLGGPVFFGLWLAAVSAGGYQLTQHAERFVARARDVLAPANLAWLSAALVLLKVLHELSHAIVCRRYGGQVRDAGVLFVLFIPLTYIDASATWRLSSVWQRIHVALAGMYIELFVASVSVLVWQRHPDAVAGLIAHNLALVASVGTVLFNANPLMRFDGYYVLSDLTGIPNLYAQGAAYVQGIWLRLLLGTEPAPLGYRGWQGVLVRVYGLTAFAWRCLVILSLLVLASKLFYGMGMVLSFLALALWVGRPLAEFCRRLPEMRQRRPAVGRRLASAVVAAGAALVVLFTVPLWRASASAPAVVTYDSQVVVRSRSPGFMRELAVQPGRRVTAGELLLRLENDELQLRLSELRLELAALAIQARRLLGDGNLSALQVLREKERALEGQAASVQQEVEQLAIRAPMDGIVVGRNLPELLGTYLPRGQELLWVVRPEGIKFTLSIAQEDVESFRAALGETLAVDMRLAGAGTVAAVLTQVEPRASTQVPDPGLSAAHAGPLAVRQSAESAGGAARDEEVTAYRRQLLLPRFVATASIPPEMAQCLRVGQLGEVRVAGARRPLGDPLRRALADRIESLLAR
jgi:putative peptide zinc metalloprotease protein